MILCRNLFQFTLLDHGLRFAKLGAQVKHLNDAFRPIKFQSCQARLLDGANQPAIGRSESQQFTQNTLVAVHTEPIIAGKVGTGQCGRETTTKVVVLFFRLRDFLFGSRAVIEIQLCKLRGRDRTVSTDDRGVHAAIGDIEIPVGDFDITDEVANLNFKVGDRDIFVQACQHNWNTIDERSSVSHQRVLHLCFEESCPIAGHDPRSASAQWKVVLVVDDLLTQGGDATGCESLTDGTLLRGIASLEERGRDSTVARVSRSVGGAVVDKRTRLSIKFGQGIFHAADLIGSLNAARQDSVAGSIHRQRNRLGGRLLDRDVVDASKLISTGAGELCGDVLTELGIATRGDKELCILQRDGDTVFDREIPKLVIVVAHR